jgi:mitochondrial import inner membrane translocase subunit TIM16
VLLRTTTEHDQEMSGKIFAQIIVTGVQVFSKAFGLAYQQAVQNARSGASATAAKAATSSGLMSVEEAIQVLNFPKEELNPLGVQKLLERYDKMYKANDPSAGGSFYLQSKVYRAKESLDNEIENMIKNGNPQK